MLDLEFTVERSVLSNVYVLEMRRPCHRLASQEQAVEGKGVSDGSGELGKLVLEFYLYIFSP